MSERKIIGIKMDTTTVDAKITWSTGPDRTTGFYTGSDVPVSWLIDDVIVAGWTTGGKFTEDFQSVKVNMRTWKSHATDDGYEGILYKNWVEVISTEQFCASFGYAPIYEDEVD